MMDRRVPTLVITGPVGVGKTSVAFEVSELLGSRGLSHAVVDLDALSWCYPRPPDDRFHRQLALRNLADIWRNHREAGAERLVLASVIESRGDLENLREAVPGAGITLVRLRASIPVLLQRVERREAGSARDWHLARAAELAEQMDRRPVEDSLIETDGVTLAEVADRVLLASGWHRLDEAGSTVTELRGELAVPPRAAATVRDARPGDGPALASIWVENAAYYVQRFTDDFQLPRDQGLVEWFEEGLRRERDPDRQRSLVAELGGQVVGFASGLIDPPLENGSRQMLPHLAVATLRIDVLGVAEAHWSKGIATALVRALEEWGQSRGAEVAITNTYHRSPVSVPFWEHRAGYSRRGLIFQKRFARAQGLAPPEA